MLQLRRLPERPSQASVATCELRVDLEAAAYAVGIDVDALTQGYFQVHKGQPRAWVGTGPQQYAARPVQGAVKPRAGLVEVEIGPALGARGIHDPHARLQQFAGHLRPQHAGQVQGAAQWVGPTGRRWPAARLNRC